MKDPIQRSSRHFAVALTVIMLCAGFCALFASPASALGAPTGIATNAPMDSAAIAPTADTEKSEYWLLTAIKNNPASIDHVLLHSSSNQVDVWVGETRSSVTIGPSDKNDIEHAATEAHVRWNMVDDTPGTPWAMIVLAITIGLFIGAFIYHRLLIRRMKQAGIDFSQGGIGNGGKNGATANSTQGMTKSGAKLYEPGKVNGPTIGQFIGQEEAVQELMELADFLKNPEKYAAIGARIPRGVVMQGPPGVGKTFLTRILATMAGVPVYAISGSEFVEMFVGVGAARVRDLFAEAKKRGKCIIFIDEFDAMGGKRSNGAGGNDERNTTLNQLLVEMDGFDPRAGIIVIAATNRLDMLDPAAIRPGRFDRTVTFHNPTRADREKLLAAYLPEKIRDRNLDLASVAWLTPNASGAVMENIANEAKIHAVREGRDSVTSDDVDEATAKVTVGARRSGLAKVLTPQEVDVLAWHEGGHALTYVKRTGKAPLRFSIVPRGDTGGHVTYGEDFELLTTRQALETRLVVCMGGWAGVYVGLDGEENTGVSGDIQSATQVAYQMVTAYGMSRLGMFSLSGYPDVSLIPDALKAEIKVVVDELLAWAKQEALKIVSENVADMRRLVASVKEKETLIAQDFEEMFLNGAGAITSGAVVSAPNLSGPATEDKPETGTAQKNKRGWLFGRLARGSKKEEVHGSMPPAITASKNR